MPLRLVLILVAVLVTAAPAAADERASSSGRDEARATLRDAKELFDGEGVETGKELSPILKDLAVQMKALPEGDRREARALLARPTTGQAQAGEEDYAPGTNEQRFCSAHFCVHWVDTTEDAPPLASGDGDSIPDYVQSMSQVFENVFAVENVGMGWREPTPDGTRGGDFNKVDVYIKQLGNQGIFGYATPDPGQSGNSQAAYLVMDNDYTSAEYPRYSSPLPPMQVTAAHEYNHVIQFGYDVLQDSWMFESTAVWMEDKVYDDINDYVAYLTPWSKLTQVPLTQFNPADLTDAQNVKVYGNAVWNRWIDERYGQDVIRTAWEKSLQTRPVSFAPDAYDAALLTQGTTFFDAFTRFVADTAEWRSAAGVFEEGPSWPDVERATRDSLLPDDGGIAGRLDHASYALINVIPTQHERFKLVASLPRDTRGAFALVGREGDEASGLPVVELRRLPRGGEAVVELENPGRFSRITAVLVNADTTQTGFSQFRLDWEFAKDGQDVRAAISTDYTPPRVRKRSPASRAKVSTKSGVTVTFSEAVRNISTKTLQLLAPNGQRISTRVSYDRAKRRARLVPKRRLSPRRRYSVKLAAAIVDEGGNPLAEADRSWKFSTRSK
ncbi:MAG: Ig-like domain-containing protein [Actinomycetota bacterium]|nr:Ig-like domain-containing protein [Actinomycetota bacterium]